MKHPLSLTLVAIALALSASASHAQDTGNALIDRHLAAATRAAKADLLGPLGLCKTATPEPAPAFMDNYKAKLKDRRWSRCR